MYRIEDDAGTPTQKGPLFEELTWHTGRCAATVEHTDCRMGRGFYSFPLNSPPSLTRHRMSDPECVSLWLGAMAGAMAGGGACSLAKMVFRLPLYVSLECAGD